MSLKSLAVRGLFWSVVQKWGGLFFHSASLLLLTRLLSPEAFGLVALANVVVAFIRVFVEQGFAQAIVQAKEVKPENLDTAFWSSLVISLLLSGATFASADAIALQFKEPNLALVLKSLSPVFVLIALNSVQTALLQRQLKFKALAVRSLLALSIGGVVAMVMALAGFGVWSLVAQELMRALVAVVVLWQVGKWRPRLRFSFSSLRSLLSFGISIMGINVLNVVNRRSDDLLVGYYLGTAALGYYNVAYQLLLLMTQLINAPVNQVAFSAFAKLQDNLPMLRKTLYSSTKMVGLVSIPAFLFAAALAPQLVPLLFGDKWGQSIPVMQVLALIGPIHAMGGLNANLMIAMGKPSWRLGFNFLNAAVNFPAFYIAVRWGIWAVALAYVVRGYLLFPLPLLATRKLTNISCTTYVKEIWPVVFSGVLATSGMICLKQIEASWLADWAMVISCVALGITIYAGCVSRVSPGTLAKVTRLVRQKAT